MVATLDTDSKRVESSLEGKTLKKLYKKSKTLYDFILW